jgi:hypothetical protein
MEQEPGGWIPLVGIKALGNGYEPDPVVFKGADVVQTVHQRATEAVQLPNQKAGEFPRPRIKN